MCLVNLPLSVTYSMQISLSLLLIKNKVVSQIVTSWLPKPLKMDCWQQDFQYQFPLLFIYLLFFCFNHFIPSTGDFYELKNVLKGTFFRPYLFGHQIVKISHLKKAYRLIIHAHITNLALISVKVSA